jgi:hypothetical protein
MNDIQYLDNNLLGVQKYGIQMATTYYCQLDNSKGLNRVIFFEGLDFPLVICPTIHDEPLLTTQAFYYLDQLESVIKIRFEKRSNFPEHKTETELERKLEYIFDNYLFLYSKKYPNEKLSSKITEYKFWRDMGHTFLGYDMNNSHILALDAANDETIVDIKDDEHPDKSYWYDWCLISNYTNAIFEKYLTSLKSVIGKKVEVETKDHDELGTGKYILPLLSCRSRMLDYYQANMLEVIDSDHIDTSKQNILVSRGFKSDNNFELPLEVFRAKKKYDADLLSYYFAGVREHLPISKFRGFYNVLEYFFEDAPLALGERARNERQQISCVVRWISDSDSIREFINGLGQNFANRIEQNLISLNGVEIGAINIASSDLDKQISRWLYEIRCACIHSKKTRNGEVSMRFVPYSQDEDIVELSIALIQNFAILCIEKDGQVLT